MDTRVLQLLQRLKLVSPGLDLHPGYRDLIDEFLREGEFGLALESICDYLLEPTSPAVPEEVIRDIEELHAVLAEQDDCVINLKAKSNVGQKGSA